MSRKFPPKRLAQFALVVLLPVALGSLRYWPRGGVAVELPVVEVHMGDLLSAVAATGTVEAHRTVDIKYDTQSLVTGLDVQEGDRVQVNQSLATMDLRLLVPALALARQALEKDRAGLTLAEASLHRAQSLAAAQILAKVDQLVEEILSSSSSQPGSVQRKAAYFSQAGQTDSLCGEDFNRALFPQANPPLNFVKTWMVPDRVEVGVCLYLNQVSFTFFACPLQGRAR